MAKTTPRNRMFGIKVIALAMITLAGIAFAASSYMSAPSEQTPTVLRISVLPDQSPEVLRSKYAPLVNYLAAQTGAEARLIIPYDYQHALSLFSENEVDLALLGGLTFVQAQARYGAVPLVMRQIDTRFTSLFLVKPELADLTGIDFRGKTFSFGSRLSTSGHLMPRHFMLENWQITPETFYSQVSYSGAHDTTAFQVRDGVVDIGVANSAIIRQMITNGALESDDLHVIWETPPYPDYVWAVQKHLPASLTNRLRDAFLQLDASNPDLSGLMEALDANVFLPADPLDFKILAATAEKLGLMEPAHK